MFEATLPKKPMFLQVGLYALLASILLVAVSDVWLREPTPAMVVSHLSGALLCAFLYCHMARGAVIAVQAYFMLEFLSLANGMLTGTFPSDPAQSMAVRVFEVLGWGASLVTIVGLLHPLTRNWFIAVQDARKRASPDEKLSKVSAELILGAAWVLASPLLLQVSAAAESPDSVPMAVVFLAVGVLIGIVQGVKYYNLRRPGGG